MVPDESDRATLVYILITELETMLFLLVRAIKKEARVCMIYAKLIENEVDKCNYGSVGVYRCQTLLSRRGLDLFPFSFNKDQDNGDSG